MKLQQTTVRELSNIRKQYSVSHVGLLLSKNKLVRWENRITQV